MADGTGHTRFRFGPLERRGLVAGWRGGQIAAVAAGLLVGVVILRSRPDLTGATLALLAVVAGAAAAAWPVAGRTAEEWAPDAARHVAGGVRSRLASRRGDPFGTLCLLQVELDGVGGGPPIRAGIVRDGPARTFTAVVAARGPGFLLLGPGDKDRRVGAWAGVLSAMAREGTAVHRVQWVERSLPDDGAEIRDHLANRRVLDGDSPAGRSYDELVAGSVPVTYRHQVLLAVTVHAGRSARAVRAAGGGDRGAATVLLREVAAFRRRLAEVEVEAGSVLDGPALVAAIRTGFEPGGRLADPAAPAPAGARWPWPMGSTPGWSRVQVDGTWHVTFWVAEWPRIEVGPDFLGPLLLLSEVRRTVSVVMEPVGPIRAARQVEQARTADIADAELRRRGGFLATARRRREEEVLARRELELADGHAQYRFSGYLTVTADDPETLEDACGRVEQAAGQAGLEIRRCYGDQLRAFTAGLPLGRGLA